jgi:hypothetical protein
MPNIDYSKCFGDNSQKAETVNEDLIKEQDWLMEQILENINTTPIGQVLKRIASLPEVRRKKVLDVRQQLNKGNYNLSERLDGALDKVLEDLTT